MVFRSGRALLSRAHDLGYTPGAMNDEATLALLPEGLHDDLPPAAAQEAALIGLLIDCFWCHGYERVKPPLIEFEESLLTGPGAQVSRHMFRLMDPISQRMMAVRSDMTTQVARIAVSRLKDLPRPLRLCYAGQVLRVRGSQLRPERQYAQAGAELIGPDAVTADAEMLLMAAAAAETAGIVDLSIDLTVPSLVPIVCRSLGLPETEAEAVRSALDRKDAAALADLTPEVRDLLEPLLRAAGPADEALDNLDRLQLPDAARALVDRLHALVDTVQLEASDLRLTVDPGESRGFEYQTGVSFTLFAKGVRGELGRGGRYQLMTEESATGFSLYLDSVMRAVPAPEATAMVFLPLGVPASSAADLRRQGWRVVRGLEPTRDARSEAKQLGCTHLFQDDQIVDLI